MVAIWQSLRPPADKRKELKETPIPQDKLGVILPLWDHISTTMTTVKTNIDIASRELEKEQPNSLATAGASSAQLRCSKLLKTTKVRDLQKSMSAVVPALTKTNLAWAGIETQKDSKACQVSRRRAALDKTLKASWPDFSNNSHLFFRCISPLRRT